MFTSFTVLEVSHNSCNIGTSALLDMYALALGCWHTLRHRAYISGNALVPMLQLLYICAIVTPFFKGSFYGTYLKKTFFAMVH